MTSACILRAAARFSLAVVVLGSVECRAGIRFEEVTFRAGIAGVGTTYGASWGDFDGDGWPDLWVGNHDNRPSLYRNDGKGRFTDVIEQVWSDDPRADTHGAQWADFDNDGDQDLIEVVGALENPDGTLCLGCGRNRLFVNDGRRLVDEAPRRGLDVDGFARSPLWFDADRDGRLDLLVASARQGASGSKLFRQRPDGTFMAANTLFGFRDERWSRSDEYLGRFWNGLDLRFDPIGLVNTRLHLESAQLVGLAPEGRLALAHFSAPTRIYAIDDVPFNELTAELGFPDVTLVNDVAAEDFDGDGRTDLYLSRGTYLGSDVYQPSAQEIRGTLTGAPGRPHTVTFRATGAIRLELNPSFLTIEEIFIGATARHPRTRAFELHPDDAYAIGPVPDEVLRKGGFAIAYDPSADSWTLTDVSTNSLIDFIVRSAGPLEDLSTSGFLPFREDGVDMLLLRNQEQFEAKTLTGAAGEDTSCFSVAAGDFDNDMDVDLYLVCTGPLRNLPNRLLENDGKGNFTVVPAAAGAAGSKLGRGDAAVVADYDGDGFLDLFVTNGMDPTSPFVVDGPHQLFRNLGNDNRWIEIDLEGAESNRDAIGAIVRIEAGGVTQLREQRGGMHRAAQNHQRIHVGLGTQDVAERITVRWPSGRTQVHQNVAVNKLVTIREDGSIAVRQLP